MRRLIDLLVAEASAHHQPSACMALAAATNRSATAWKSASVVVQAEDEAAGTNPAQRQSMRPQVELQHPVVARGPRVADGPDRGDVGHLDRQLGLAQQPVEVIGTAVPGRIQVAVDGTDLRRIDPLQKLMHRAHHVRMGVERAAGKADVGGAVIAEALHQIAAAAHRADRQAAAQRLAVGDHVRLDAEIVLRPARGEPESDEHLIENQHDVALGADLAQALQPVRIGRPVEAALCGRHRPATYPPARPRSDAALAAG